MATQINKNQIKDEVVRKALAFSTAGVSVDNSTTETTIFSEAIAANILDDDQAVVGEIHGYLENGGGADRSYTLRLKANGNTVANGSATIHLNMSGSYTIKFMLAGDGDDTTQLGTIHAVQGGIEENNAGGGLRVTGAGSEDATASITITVTIQLASAVSGFAYTSDWYELKGPYVQ